MKLCRRGCKKNKKHPQRIQVTKETRPSKYKGTGALAHINAHTCGSKHNMVLHHIGV